MTALGTTPSASTTHAALSGDLLDALCEAVVAPAGPGARSAVICSLVQEVCSSLEWRHEGLEDMDAATHDELISIRRLAALAHGYHVRMTALGSSVADDDGHEPVPVCACRSADPGLLPVDTTDPALEQLR